MTSDDRVLVDYRTSDDAGVYRIDERRALVQTVDFFTPVVDDPVAYGRIAGANALSDVYAMGGRPLTALAIAGFPKDADRAILSADLQGRAPGARRRPAWRCSAATRCRTRRSSSGTPSPGRWIPARMWTNAGASAGDRLFLTKPIGTGVIATAIKFDRAPRARSPTRRSRRWCS